MNKKPRFRIDIILVLTIFALLAFGTIMVYSTTLSFAKPVQNSLMKTHFLSLALGILVMFVLMLIDYNIWGKLYLFIYAGCILLLIATLLFGKSVHDAKSWIQIGSKFSFQPSEFVKVGLIISLAKYIENNIDKLNNPFVLLKILAFAFLPVLLILLQPDFGTAIVYVFFIFIMLFSQGISLRYVMYAIGLGVLSIPALWFSMNQYQKNRIYDFLDPNRDAMGSGRQVIQGKIALGSGKLFGRGLFKGTQNMYKYVPEKHTDSIFAIVGEETGFFGGAIMIFLYYCMLSRMINIAKNSDNVFGSAMVSGFLGMFLFHIVQNIGMILGILPVTGIPLPFISYAGTFQLTSLACIGLVLSVNYNRGVSRFIDKSLDFIQWL